MLDALDPSEQVAATGKFVTNKLLGSVKWHSSSLCLMTRLPGYSCTSSGEFSLGFHKTRKFKVL